MKIIGIAVVRTGSDLNDPIPLTVANDLSSFGFFQRQVCQCLLFQCCVLYQCCLVPVCNYNALPYPGCVPFRSFSLSPCCGPFLPLDSLLPSILFTSILFAPSIFVHAALAHLMSTSAFLVYYSVCPTHSLSSVDILLFNIQFINSRSRK
jgi:hypothetical protein